MNPKGNHRTFPENFFPFWSNLNSPGVHSKLHIVWMKITRAIVSHAWFSVSKNSNIQFVKNTVFFFLQTWIWSVNNSIAIMVI